MITWVIILVFAVLQNGKLTATFPLGQSQVDLLSSFWINPNITEAGLDLLEALAKVDEELDRSNEYSQIMLESGEEDDQLSRLLYRLQTHELQRNSMQLRRRRKALSENNPSHKQEDPSFPHRRPLALTGRQKDFHRENRKRKKSKEKRRPSNCKGKSREQHNPKGHERHRHRSREKPKPRGSHSRERIGPKTLVTFGYKSKEKHRRKSQEKCLTDADTTTLVTSPRPTTATLPSTTRNTIFLTQNPSSPTSMSPGLPSSSNLPAYTVEYANDVSLSYEKVTFSPDAETLIPFL